MKRELVMAACFCLAGILCSSLFGYEYFTACGFLTADSLQAFADMQAEFAVLFANVLWERGKLFLLLALLSATAFKQVLPLVFRCVLYLTAGMFLAACVMNLGMTGVLFFLAALLPHGVLYLLAVYLLFHVDARRFYNRKNPVLKRTALYLGMASLMLLGCALEASAGKALLSLAAAAALS